MSTQTTSRNMSTSNMSRKYHQGWMHMKFRSNYRRFFAQLLSGKELRLYQDEARSVRKNDFTDVHIISLDDMTEIEQMKDVRQSNMFPGSMLILRFKEKENIKMRFENIDERGVWERYLMAVCLGKFPARTDHLLPGQTQELMDIMRNEHGIAELKKQKSAEEQTHPWFYPNMRSRYDAEEILKKQTDKGNALIRMREAQSSDDEYNYVLSARIESNPDCFKHFKIKWDRERQEYIIDLGRDTHPRLETLESVMSFFEKQKKRNFRRLSVSTQNAPHLYEARLGPIYQNEMAHHDYLNFTVVNRPTRNKN